MKKTLTIALATLLIAACSNRTLVPAGATNDDMAFAIGELLPSPPFTGEAYLKPMIQVDSIFHFPTTNTVTFAPGSHSAWHCHGGMVLLITSGVGIYQEEGKAAQILRKGDVVQIPAGVRHWHGATKDNWFQQVVIYDAAWKPEASVDEDNTLSDEYYYSLQLEEFAERKSTHDSLMFAAPDTTMTLPTFNGPIRLANTLGDDNTAGSPALHYVVFEPGVINAWHTHAGGQVLICTDGVGYHQIEGQPVEVLHPGDVAKCPPGVKHWHGAAPNSRFAHLAANTNPDKPGVEWFDMLSKEEYETLPIK